MPEDTLKLPLELIASAVWPYMKKVRAERRAGQNPFATVEHVDVLDRQLDEVLSRLGAISAHKTFWRSLLDKAGGRYVRPDFFEIESVREWLGDEAVQSAFKKLVRSRLANKKLDPALIDLARDKYSHFTGEQKGRSTYALTVVLAVMHASVEAVLDDGQGVVAGLVSDFRSEASVEFEKLSEKISEISPEQDQLHSETLEEKLTDIVRRRAIPGEEIVDQIENLAKRAESGDLSRAAESVKVDVWYWCSRLLASVPSRMQDAEAFLLRYREHSLADPAAVMYLEANLESNNGDISKAIASFASLDTIDARTSLFLCLAKRDGNDAALEWFEELRPHDENLFSPVGWRNVAIKLAESGLWEEGLDILQSLSDESKIEFPELLVVEGILHAGFILPSPLRIRLLNPTNIDYLAEAQQGDSVTQHRALAIDFLERAKSHLTQLGAHQRTEGCDYHLCWVRLTDPAQREAVLEELKVKMEEGESAARLLDIALSAKIEFDRKSIDRYLRRRKLEGTAEAQDDAIQLGLLLRFGTPDEVLSYIEEQHENLDKIVGPTVLVSIKINALVEGGRLSDAEAALESSGSAMNSEDAERHRLMIADRKGEELKSLEALYERTGEYADLQNLVRYLSRTRQWDALHPHATKLLADSRSAENLLNLVEAQHHGVSDDTDVLQTLQKFNDLIVSGTPIGDALLIYKVWALSNIGELIQAADVISGLVGRRHDPQVISLEISLALRTGRWEQFTTIVEREKSHLDELPSSVLLQMAAVISDWDADRAISVAGMAAVKSPDDGNVQANAYSLASQVGREVEASEWLERMFFLSEGGRGPGQKVSLREIAEMMPSRLENTRNWSQQFSTGDLGLHPAAKLLNLPLAHILVGEPLRNETEAQFRIRSVVPVRHGSRKSFTPRRLGSVAFDTSTLLILEFLGVVDDVLALVDNAYLSPHLLEVLFIEHKQVRYHQPSVVEEAKRVRNLIADGVIRVLPNTSPPEELVSEAGLELSTLLYAAANNKGRVVSSLPIHKSGTLAEEIADLGEYSHLILKTTQLLPYLEKQMPQNLYKQAESYLTSSDRGEALGVAELDDCALYIDNLALKYLGTAGVLNFVNSLDRDIWIAAAANVEMKNLIDAASQGDQAAAVIDSLRKRLRAGIDSGKVRFVREQPEAEQDDSMQMINALQDIVASANLVDAICIDDRSIGRFANMADDSGNTTPLLGTIDLLDALASSNGITKEARIGYEYKLWRAGFGLLSPRLEWIKSDLLSSIDNESEDFKETGFLRAIRENLMRIRTMKMVRLPEEIEWFSKLAPLTLELLQSIWIDENLSPQVAENLSDWVLESLAPLPTSWNRSVILAEDEDYVRPTYFSIARILNIGNYIVDLERKRAFSVWSERRLIEPLRLANDSLIEEMSDYFSKFLAEAAVEFANADN